jgi:hypothetical protein
MPTGAARGVPHVRAHDAYYLFAINDAAAPGQYAGEWSLLDDTIMRKNVRMAGLL